jgi:flagellar protein FliO/FliZ
MSPRLISLFCLLSLPALALAQATAPATPGTSTALGAKTPGAAVQAPLAAPAPDLGGSALQMFFGLIVVLALMVGALWLLKQLTQKRGEANGLLRVVAGTGVGARERVVIVEVGSTWLVLGVAPGRVTPLAEVPRQALPPEAERRPASTDFPAWLQNLTGGRR